MTDLKSNWATGESYAATDQNAVATGIHGLNQKGAFASLPAAGFTGRLYYCTDVGLLLRDNGSSWDRIDGGPLNAFTAPPTSSWSTVNLGSATFAASLDGRLFTLPSGSGTNYRMEVRTLSPSSNYTATFYMETAMYWADHLEMGIILRNSSSGNFIFYGPAHETTPLGGFGLRAVKYSSPTVGVADYANQALTRLPAGLPSWLRVRDDGTNRYFEYSYVGGSDTSNWMLHFSIGRTDFITPDQIGWGGNNDGSGRNAYARLRSYAVA